jgi:hypothetical protein
VRGPGDRIGIQNAGEVRGLDHDPARYEFQIDLDLVAGRDSGGLLVGDAEAE